MVNTIYVKVILHHLIISASLRHFLRQNEGIYVKGTRTFSRIRMKTITSFLARMFISESFDILGITLQS